MISIPNFGLPAEIPPVLRHKFRVNRTGPRACTVTYEEGDGEFQFTVDDEGRLHDGNFGSRSRRALGTVYQRMQQLAAEELSKPWPV